MTSIYRPILKIAWQILWRAKYLWFFGLFAVLVSNSGELNLIINNFSIVSEQGPFLRNLKLLYSQGVFNNPITNLKELVANFNLSAIILLILFIALFLFLIWLAVVAQAGLVSGAYREYRKQPSGFVSAFKTGRQNFWPVLALNVIGKIVIYGALLIVGLPLVLLYLKQPSETGQLLFVLLSFIILIPLAVIVSFLIKYAIIFVVLKKEKVGQALKSGWRLFIKNWVVTVEMAIILFLISILTGIVMILVTVILAIPLSLLVYIFYILQVEGLLMLAVILALLLLVLLIFWLGTLLSTYQMTCWVLLFDRLTESQVFSKISRLVAGWTSRKKVTSNQ